MATIVWGTKLHEESGVTVPAGNGAEEAFDLELYRDANSSSRAFLAVNMSMQMFFQDNEDTGNAWDYGGRQQFMTDFKDSIYSVWDNQWEIKLTSDNLAIETVLVFFFVNLIEREWSWSEHYEVTVTKASGSRGITSKTNIRQMTAALDSNDTVAVSKKGTGYGCSGSACGVKQRGAPHEFGHMIGLRDEYPGAKRGISSWKNDGDSIMHSGEAVKPRHYTIFLPFLKRAFANEARFMSKAVEFKVDGTWDLSSAHLGDAS